MCNFSLKSCFLSIILTLPGWGIVFAQYPSDYVANFDDAAVPVYTLPDPLVLSNGEKIADAETWWQRRRPEILALFENEMYGKTPTLAGDLPDKKLCISYELLTDKPDALGGKATRQEVRVHFGKEKDAPFLDLLIYIPNKRSGAVPAFLGLNFRGNQAVTDEPDVMITKAWVTNQNDGTTSKNRALENSRGAEKSRWPIELIIDRGYALITAYYGDLDPDFDDGFQDGVHPYFYRGGQTKPGESEWGSIGAWAWGLSRTLDYLETENRIDAKRVAVIGHSRLGKTALWAAAQDQRFALVVANNSGFGGGSLSKRVFGETVYLLNYVRPQWFADSFVKYNNNEEALSMDQHELLALIAPRPVYLASAVEDRPADPKGELLTALNADAVYRLLGTNGMGDAIRRATAEKDGMYYDVEMPPLGQPIGDVIRYHIREGGHDITTYDWEQYLDFADRVMR